MPHVRLVLRNGREHWLFEDGRLMAVIAGGDGTADTGGSADNGGEGGGNTGEGDPPDLGEAGKRALAAERETRKAAEKAQRDAERRIKTMEAELAKFRDADKTELERAVEVARREAAEAAKTEATQSFNRRILEAEVKTAAAGKLSDPTDAVRLLDLDEFAVGDDGTIDAKPIMRAIDALIKEKPYLAAVDPRRRHGSGDGGPRGNGGGAGDDSPGEQFGRLIKDQLRR